MSIKIVVRKIASLKVSIFKPSNDTVHSNEQLAYLDWIIIIYVNRRINVVTAAIEILHRIYVKTKNI